MRYFEDLLDSYTRLKKRTFKIRYISEQMGDPTSDIILTIGKYATGPQWQEMQEFGGAFKVRQSKDGIAVLYKKIQRQSNIIDLSNNKIEPNNTAKTIWEALYKAYSGQEDEDTELTPEQEAAQALQQKQEEAGNRIGGSLEVAGIPVTAPTRGYLLSAFDKLNKYITSLGTLPAGSDPSLVNLTMKPLAYLAGASRFGFEYKLANAQSVVYDDNGNAIGVSTPDEGLIEVAAEANSMLVSFLTGEGDCEKISTRVGKFKDQLVFFGTESNEGVVMRPNTMHNIALDKMSEQCGDMDLTTLVNNQVDGKSKSAVKGTFYESILQLTQILYSAKKSGDSSQIKEAFKTIATTLNEKRAELEAAAAEIDPNAGAGIDLAWERSIIEEQLGTASSQEALRKFILNEIAASLPIIEALDADGVRSSGKTSNTGGRADTVFTYKDQARAEKAAKLIGSEAIWNEQDQTWDVGSGQKRLVKLHGAKMGEINSTDRMRDIFNEDAPVDKDLAPGFYKKIDEMMGMNPSRKSKMKSFANQLEDELSKLKDQLTKDSTYINSNGEIKATTAEQNFDIVADSLKGTMTPDEFRKHPIGKAILDGEGEYRDFSDPVTRERAAEAIVRLRRFQMIKKNLGKQECRDYVVRQALICGGNATGLSQIVVDDSGESWVYSTDELFDRVLKDPNIKFELSGDYSIRVSGGGVSFSFSQEGTTRRTSTGNARDTRSQTTINTDSIRTLDKNLKGSKKTKKNESSLLLQFLRGQQRLLETLINETRTNDLVL